MEIAVKAWNPYLKKDIECLEKIQHRATKLVPELKNLEYSDRLGQKKNSCVSGSPTDPKI